MLWLLSFLFVVISGCRKGQAVTRTEVEGRVVETSGKKGKTLVAVEIVSIRINEVPRYAPSGERWDPWAPLSENPDVYVRLAQKERTIYRSEVKEDFAFTGVIDVVKELPFAVEAFTTNIRIEVFDEDGISGDDNIGYFEFNLMDHLRKDKISFANAEGTLRLELGIRSVYEK